MSVGSSDASSASRGLTSRDRLLLLAAIAVVTALAWVYLVWLARNMSGMPGMSGMPRMAMDMALKPWQLYGAIAMLVMWWVMMVGMMLPSATAMILTFATVNRRRRERGKPYVATAIFVGGYLIAWGGFSIGATAAQWGLEQVSLLSPMMASNSPVFGGSLLIAAGIYQFTPIKHACLRHCRSPFDFILNRWRDGTGGALSMGIEHGFYCLGCCWVAMSLLFVFGVMNLLWIAALTVLVLLEKALPGGMWIGRLGGGGHGGCGCLDACHAFMSKRSFPLRSASSGDSVRIVSGRVWAAVEIDKLSPEIAAKETGRILKVGAHG